MEYDDSDLKDAIWGYIESMSDSEKNQELYDFFKDYIDEHMNESDINHFIRYREFS